METISLQLNTDQHRELFPTNLQTVVEPNQIVWVSPTEDEFLS